MYWRHYFKGTIKTRQCLTGHPVAYLGHPMMSRCPKSLNPDPLVQNPCPRNSEIYVCQRRIKDFKQSRRD